MHNGPDAQLLRSPPENNNMTSLVPILYFSAGLGARDYSFLSLVNKPDRRERWSNQRRERKNRRRAHAAGVKNAFKKH